MACVKEGASSHGGYIRSRRDVDTGVKEEQQSKLGSRRKYILGVLGDCEGGLEEEEVMEDGKKGTCEEESQKRETRVILRVKGEY